MADPFAPAQVIAINARLESQARVMADSTQVYQLIMNLCTNAAQSLPGHQGNIGVKVEDDAGTPTMEPDQRMVRLSVSDDGQGIEPELWTKYLIPFSPPGSPGWAPA